MKGRKMKRAYPFWAALFLALLAGPGAMALDDLSASMKQFLDHRGDDFASLRKDPHGSGDETAYASSVILSGAMQCYIAQTAKPHFSNECDVMETKSRATLNAKYRLYVKALRDASPASWTTWTDHPAKAMGELTYEGPDRSHPAAAVHWVLEGMNMDWYDLSVTFYGEGYTLSEPK
jgi:hypothetical protein